MKKINWCKILGHKWIPVFIRGYYGKKEVKFIGAECKRCILGEDDLRIAIEKMENNIICSYSEKYYYEDKW